MQLILTISPQPATQMKERQAVLLSCYRDGSLLLDARDGEKPAQFRLTPSDSFPWEDFIQKLLLAWQLADLTDVPSAFRPTKRLPQFVLDEIGKEPLENKLKILATLRKQGYFPTLQNR